MLGWHSGGSHATWTDILSIPEVAFSTGCFRILRQNFKDFSLKENKSLSIRFIFTTLLLTCQGDFGWTSPTDICLKPGWVTGKSRTEPTEPRLQVQPRARRPGRRFSSEQCCVSNGSFLCFSGQRADLLWKQSRWDYIISYHYELFNSFSVCFWKSASVISCF